MPRFAVLAHDWPEPHFDLFLEAGSTLQSWKLPADFSPPARSSILLGAPHRLLYLDYEGPVSAGRGSVSRWGAGEFRRISETQVHFFGTRLAGLYEWLKDGTGQWTFGPVT